MDKININDNQTQKLKIKSILLNYLQLLIVFFSLVMISYSQIKYDSIVPHPRQIYIKEEFSAVFAFRPGMKLYISQSLNNIRIANEFNEELRKRGFDTLEIEELDDEINSTVSGVVLGTVDNSINKLFEKLNDQKIAIEPSYPGPEGYIIDVMPLQAIIAGSDERGLHYGINTFFQMLDMDLEYRSIFACRIIDAPEFPVRWFYYPVNYLVGANIDKLKPIWSQCSDLKLNGVLNSDYKWGFIEQMPQRYFDSLVSVRDFAKEKYIDIVPGVFSFGYSGDILFHNPNWASGLPVKFQKFYIEADTGRLVPSINVTLNNGNLENHNGNNFPGFPYIDDPGIKSFADTEIKHSGNVSLRFENFDSPDAQSKNARFILQKIVKPFTLYHMSAWIKTENLTSNDETRMTAIGKNGITLCYTSLNVPSNTDWRKFDVTFNSLEYDTINIYYGTWSGTGGKIWWDDLIFEEAPFINMLRRPGTPINVSHPILDIAYIEGSDYDSLYDAKTGRTYGYGGDYDSWHQIPTFKIKEGSNIHNGDTILISYYHAAIVYEGQVMITMSDPDVYEQIEKEFKIIDSLYHAKHYFMGHDEIRVMNWDYGDQTRGLTPAEILADNTNKCFDIIRKYNSDAEIWDWNDMFDEYHNAKKSNYYLVNGDMTGSADLINKEIGISNWNSGNHENSLEFFAGKGFRQISAPYYDQDENNIRMWKEWTQNTQSFKGMMYTTWQSKFTHLKPFAEYSWNHAPYIYHYPIKVLPQESCILNVNISGDNWDKGWQLGECSLFFRFYTNSEFTEQKFQPIPGEDTGVLLNIQDSIQFLQYYFEAKDKRGWTTKIPYGDNKYFELGEPVVDVQEVVNVSLKIYPNPVKSGDKITFENNLNSLGNNNISIYDVLGNNIPVTQMLNGKTISMNTDNLTPGLYFLIANMKNGKSINKLIVY